MTAQKALTEILSAFVNDTEPKLDAKMNFADIFVMAYFQNILPVIAYMNSKFHLTDNDEISAKLKDILYQTVYAAMNRFSDFEALSRLLSQEGIRHMPVKGWYIKDLYPASELRTFGDIDILIHLEDRKRCNELLLKNGYTVKNDWEPTFSYVKDSELYEFHTNLIDTELAGAPKLSEYFEKAWDFAEQDTEMRYRLTPEYHFIYVVSHLAKHLYSSGAGIRMYLDIALMLKSNELTDYGFVYAELQKIGLGRFYETVIACVNDWFGVGVSVGTPEVDKKITDRLLEYTLSSDLFGKTRNHSAATLRKSDKSKGAAILKTVFPDTQELEKRYTFIKGRKWLVPAAWAARAVKNSSLIGKRLSEIKKISKTDSAEVEDYDSFMTSLGL